MAHDAAETGRLQPLADQAAGVSLSPELRVAVTDANGGLLDVTFHGRTVGGGPAFSVVGVASGQPARADVRFVCNDFSWLTSVLARPLPFRLRLLRLVLQLRR